MKFTKQSNQRVYVHITVAVVMDVRMRAGTWMKDIYVLIRLVIVHT